MRPFLRWRQTVVRHPGRIVSRNGIPDDARSTASETAARPRRKAAYGAPRRASARCCLAARRPGGAPRRLRGPERLVDRRLRRHRRRDPHAVEGQRGVAMARTSTSRTPRLPLGRRKQVATLPDDCRSPSTSGATPPRTISRSVRRRLGPERLVVLAARPEFSPLAQAAEIGAIGVLDEPGELKGGGVRRIRDRRRPRRRRLGLDRPAELRRTRPRPLRPDPRAQGVDRTERLDRGRARRRSGERLAQRRRVRRAVAADRLQEAARVWRPGDRLGRRGLRGDLRVQVSDDEREWQSAFRVEAGNGGRDYIYLPDKVALSAARYRASARGANCSSRSIEIRPYQFASSPNHFFAAIAEDAPRALSLLRQEQSYFRMVKFEATAEGAVGREPAGVEPARAGARSSRSCTSTTSS